MRTTPLVAVCVLAAVMTPTTAGQQLTRLLAADSEDGDYFGNQVAGYGDVMTASALGDDDMGEDAGAIYVYRFDGSGWTLEEKVVSSVASAGSKFGSRMDVTEDLLVGLTTASAVWRAYVHEFDGSTWVRRSTLIPSDGDPEDQFGLGLAIDSDVVVAGAPGVTGLGPAFGAAYVFRRSGSTWSQEQILLPPSRRADDRFGGAVDVDGDVIVAGSSGSDSGTLYNVGSVYVYRYDGSTWIEEQRLWSSGLNATNYFGESVAIDGNVIVAGATHKFTVNPIAGAAYVFRYDGANWIEEQQLVPDDGEQYDWFGTSVAIRGNRILVGASYEDDGAENSGAVYVFQYDGSSWNQVARLKAGTPVMSQSLGLDVDFAGDWALASAFVDSTDGARTGAAYYVDLETGVDAEPTPDLPSSVVLDQNYPNPFNPSTTMAVELEAPGTATLSVYDLTGREVAVVHRGMLPAGRHEFVFSDPGLPSGIYVYRLQSPAGILTRTMALIR